MDSENVVLTYLYAMEFFSAINKNEILLFAGRESSRT
jgi:hypothetical protein